MANPVTESGSRKRCRIDWWVIAILVLPCLYFLPELIGTSVFAGIDTSRLNMPLRYFDRLAFASGQLPLWNPYVYAGFPNLAESESGVFYPGNIFIHMPGDFFHWYSIEVIAHFMVAGLGFYTWMRVKAASKPVAAFLAATYLTTPFLVFHITAMGLFTSIVWLPWYLVLFDTGLKSRHPVRIGLWLALFLGVMLMSGSPQAAFLGSFALVLYGIGKIIVQPDGKSRTGMLLKSLAVLVPAVIAPVIAAIQIIPTFELTALSERAATSSLEFYRIGTWLTVPKLVSLVVFPALEQGGDIQDYASSLCFLGVVPFVFAVAGIFMWRERGRKLFPLLFAGIITLVLAFGLNLPIYKYLVLVPPFGMFRYPGRFAFITLTMLLPLAVPGLDYLISPGKTVGEEFGRFRMGIIIGSLVILAAGGVGIALVGGSAGTGAVVSTVILLISIVLLSSVGRIKSAGIVKVLIAVMLCVSLGVQIGLMYPFSRFLTEDRGKFDESVEFFDELKADFGSEEEIPRILMAGSFYLMDPDALSRLGYRAQEDIWDNMSGNASGLGEVTSLRGLTPLNQNNWKLVLRETLQSRIDTVIDRAREMGEPKVADAVSMRIIRMLGADYILLEGDDWTVEGYELWEDDLALPFHEGMCAYRSVWGQVPDAWFVERTKEGRVDFARFTNWIGSAGRDTEMEALVETTDQDNVRLETKSYSENAVITERARGFDWLRFKVEVEGPDDGFLVTGENYYPGWKAFIDGEETEYFRTDFVVGGVRVPPGEHEVELRYRPRSVLVGAYGSLTGILVWAILMGAVLLIYRSGRGTEVVPVEEDES